ncbi:MAG: hypothetical protein PHW62_00400 [Candidatus Ratteibacteria bacterium]|nr:hypothetical protein [Candidatus Ratteibacteria bacterium]
MYREIQNIDKIPVNRRGELKSLVEGMDEILIRGGAGSMSRGFFMDCVNGQIIISLMPRKSKERYYNKISDFYIDSRVGFSGIRAMEIKKGDLETYFRSITKYRPRRFNIGDMVRIKNPPSHNAWLRDNPATWGKTAKVKKIMERSLSDLDYEGLEIQFGGKGSWVYVGSSDVTKVQRRK